MTAVEVRAFPWAQAMHLGFGVLRLSSTEFWGLTPRELAAAVAAPGGRQGPPRREDLAGLMAQFPDKVHHG